MTLHNSDSAIELRLQSFIQRIENVESEQAALTTDKAEIYKELKSQGLDAGIVRKVVKLRAMDPAKRAEMDDMLARYREAAGV